MPRMLRSSVLSVNLALPLALVASCARGGGGSQAGGASLQLSEIRYGRLVETAGGAEVVSPLSTVEHDAQGNVVEDSVRPLTPAVDLEVLPRFGLQSLRVPRQPPVIPRDAVLQLEFTDALDKASIRQPVLAADGTVSEAGSVDLRSGDREVAYRLILASPRVLWLHPEVGPHTSSFPPTPVAFGADGSVVADAVGSLRLSFSDHPDRVLRDRTGRELQPRADELGTAAVPVRCNPGNPYLDFIQASELLDWTETYGGFLPERSPLRLVRQHRLDGTAQAGGGDFLRDSRPAFDTASNQGRGEWAGGLLVLRPGRANEETRVVLSHSVDTLEVDRRFDRAVRAGDRYRLERWECFEPDPTDPIDPRSFDPFNPQGATNRQLASFVEVVEIDASGVPVGDAFSLVDSPVVPPFSELRLRFRPRLDGSSALAFESVLLGDRPAGPEGSEPLFGVELSADGETLTLRPGFRREDGSWQLVGWGISPRPLSLALVTVPEDSHLEQLLPADQLASFLAEGWRGLKGYHGRPLAFPPSWPRSLSPRMEYTVDLDSDSSASKAANPPVPEDWGFLLLRFRGRPVPGVHPYSGEPTLQYRDGDYQVGPLVEINAAAGGVLTGHPLGYVRRVYDDLHPSVDDPWLQAYRAAGLAYPLASAYPPGALSSPHHGARFQHLYRDVDCSPGGELLGAALDLYRVSWATFNPVTTDLYEDVSIYAGHSSQRPFLYQNGTTNIDVREGLGPAFDFDTWYGSWLGSSGACAQNFQLSNGPNAYRSSLEQVVSHVSYAVSATTTEFDGVRGFHPWPEFENRFPFHNGRTPSQYHEQITSWNDRIESQVGYRPWVDQRRIVSGYDNRGGDSLLLEYRIQPQETVLSLRNGIVFAPVVNSAWIQFPLYRVFSVGGGSNSSLFPDQVQNDVRARCAAGSGGPGTLAFGASERYFMAFDYVKATAIIESTYVGVTGTTAPQFGILQVLPATTGSSPPLAQVSASAALDAAGTGATRFTADASHWQGFTHLSFRFRLESSVDGQQTPIVDRVMVPYRR